LTAPDHLGGFFAPIPALISAAEATKNLRVGTNVLNNDFRHPVLVAREAATVDLLTEGRLELGLGAGHMQSEYRQAGLNFDTGGIRVERLAEAVTVIKRLLDGEQVTLTGRHYHVTGHTIFPLPVQRPHPSHSPDPRACVPSLSILLVSGTARHSHRTGKSSFDQAPGLLEVPAVADASRQSGGAVAYSLQYTRPANEPKLDFAELD
jgi:Luciferase-like monooxygenase